MANRVRNPSHETPNYWINPVGEKGFEVYKLGLTHSTRCAQIGFTGAEGMKRAIAECDRREAADKNTAIAAADAVCKNASLPTYSALVATIEGMVVETAA